MKIYESVCIVSPSQTDEEIGKLTRKVTETIERAGATLIKVVNEGKKKLAYEIKHERRGTYLIVQFEGKGNAVSELERYLRMEDSIMKFLTVEISPEMIKTSTDESETAEVGAGASDGRVQ